MNRLLSRSTALKWVNGATVLLAALAVRLVYCFALAPRQLCGLNDRSNFELAAAVCNAMSNSTDILGFGKALVGQFIGTSTALDAMVRQGPLYPLYLSALIKSFGLPASFDPTQTNCMGFVIANVILSALSCVFIYYCARFAFNRRTGLIAALIAMFYAPAVVNVMHCYPETLSNFLVSGWLCLICSLLLRHEKTSKLPALFFIGVISALIVLCTPSLLLMPPIMAVALILYKLGEPLKRHFSQSPAKSAHSATSPEGQTVFASDAQGTSPADAAETPVLDFSSVPPAAQEEVAEPAAESSSPEKSEETPRVAAGEANLVWSPIKESEQEQKSEDTITDTAPQEELATPSNPTSVVSTTAESAPVIEAETPANQVATEDLAPAANLNMRKLYIALLVAVAGVAVVIAPWLWFQNASNNTLDLFSEPTISSRLWLGNMLASEGWRLLPGADFPFSSVRLVARNLLSGISSNPVPYVTLILQKLARLWCGGWNDFEVTAYGMDVHEQNVIHSLLLLSGYLGFCLIVLHHTRWRWSRAIPCAVAASVIILCHGWLSFFDPLSRNNLTAMPAVILLSAYCIQHLLTHSRKLKFQALIVIIVSTLFFAWLQSGNTTVPVMMEIFASDVWGRGFDVFFVILAWIFLTWLVLPIVQDISGAKVSIASDMVKFGCFGVALIVVACGMTDERWREWTADLKTHGEQIEQKIWIPQLSAMFELSDPARRSGEAFVLVDLESPGMLPPASISVNDEISTEPPMPWIQLKPSDTESMRIIQTQADGMGKDWRRFRQWWAVAVPFSALKFGEENTIDVSFSESVAASTYKVYGEYGRGRLTRNDSYKMMPSLSTLSWEKGFATYEAGDMRLLETPVLGGRVTESSIRTENLTQKDDLSFDRGRQCGQYRIRLAVPENTNISSLSFSTITQPPGASSSAIASDMKETTLFNHVDAIGVSDSDPKSSNITPNGIPISSARPATRYLFSCDVQSLSGSHCGCIKVEFTGTKPNGDRVSWISPFAPHIVPISSEWQPLSFCDELPDSISSLNDLKVNITAQPQDPARVILHPDINKTQAIALQKVSLKLLPPLDMPSEKDRDWVLF